MEELVEYIDHKITAYLEKIEENKEYLRIHPRTRRAEKIEENALLKIKVDTLREIKLYIKVMGEDK